MIIMIDIVVLNINNKLEKTLLSICMQSIKDRVKVYIVGNRPVKHIKEFKKRINLEVVKCNDNDNMMSIALKCCKSEYFLFINSGNLFYNQLSLEKMFNLRNNYDIVIGKIISSFCPLSLWNIEGKLYRKEFIDNIKVSFDVNNCFNYLMLLYGASYVFTDYNILFNNLEQEKNNLLSDFISIFDIIQNSNYDKERFYEICFEIIVLMSYYRDYFNINRSYLNLFKEKTHKYDYSLNNNYIKEILKLYFIDKKDAKKILADFYQ